MAMTPIVCRIFLFLDEWGYIGLSLFLLQRWIVARRVSLTIPAMPRDEFTERAWRYAFIVVAVLGAVFVYGIAYPMYYNLSNEHPFWWPTR